MADKEKKTITTYNMVLIAVSAALITICSWITIPIGPVPFTLQTLGILAVLMTIGGKRGTIAILVYLLLGLVGVPVFAGFKGGAASLLGPTGGFLVGFILSGALYFILEKFVFKRLMTTTPRRMLFGIVNSLIFEVVLYTVGVIWFMTVYAAKTGPIGLGAVMEMCVIPFIIPDIVKLIVAVLIGERAGRVVKPD